MIHGYPYTDFHELNLDYILSLCRSSMGLHLEQSGKFLKLVNAQGDEISKLQIFYAQTALQDDIGNNIDAYIINAGVESDTLVLTKGNGETITITIPYAVKAKTDLNGKDIRDYISGLSVQGNRLLIEYGNGNTYTVTVPFATAAEEDVNGKKLVTYMANVITANDKLIFMDGAGNVVTEITVPYAVKSKVDYDGDDFTETYGVEITAGVTTVELRNKKGVVLSTITVPYAVTALRDTEGHAFLSDYGYHLGINGNKVTLDAHDGTKLNEITVPFAVLATDATNAIETVQLSGDEVVFTTYGGQAIRITVPYAVKALKDNLNNTLSQTYIANAVNDPLTGKITFYAQDGSVIAEMVPTVDSAVHDSVGNVIADFVKAIVTDPNSNYVTVTHGTGVTDTLLINYATKAWKDTYDNVIGNTYIRRLACEVDEDTGHYMLVAYNGELSEIFRIELRAYMAQVDVNGKNITSYVAAVVVNALDNTKVDVEDGEGNVVNTIQGSVTTTPTGTISATATGTNVTVTTGSVNEVDNVGSMPTYTYDSNTNHLIITDGVVPTTNAATIVTGIDTITDPTITATFAGNSSTDDIDFSEV